MGVSLPFGDRGVLGGVGGCEGGLGTNFGGPKFRFSKILPETKQTISFLHARPSFVNVQNKFFQQRQEIKDKLGD